MAAATGSRSETEVGVGGQPVPGGLEELVLDGGEVGPRYQAHVIPLGLPKIMSSLSNRWQPESSPPTSLWPDARSPRPGSIPVTSPSSDTCSKT